MSTNDSSLQTAFTVDALRNAAELKAGQSDYGSNSYMAGLEALLYSIEQEAHLNQRGQVEMSRRIVDALANRLTVVAWEKANPELASAVVRSPLIIVGLPRTGSSILHETLATAPNNRTPLIWEVRDFFLADKVENSNSDERVQKIDAAIESKNQIAPGYAAMHFEGAHIRWNAPPSRSSISPLFYSGLSRVRRPIVDFYSRTTPGAHIIGTSVRFVTSRRADLQCAGS